MKRTGRDVTADFQDKKTSEPHPASGHNGKTLKDTEPEVNQEILPETEEQTGQDPYDRTDEETKEAVRVLDQELSDIKDRYMRLLAEYDNFRRRTQREREGLYTDAVADVTKEWLLVMDNVERAIVFAGAAQQEKTDTVSEGMAMIYKQASEVLSKLGVEEIPSDIGTPFDPNLHAAVAHIEDDSLGEQCIAQIFLKGYRKGDRVIRHSLVQVAN